MKQSVLVLDADQYIGRSVVAALQRSDWATPIRAVRRSGAVATQGAPVAERVVQLTRADSLAAALRGVSAVVNCVTGDPATIRDSAAALVQAAQRELSLPRLVHISSMAAYGSTEGTVTESSPLRGDLGAYSAAKVAAEAAIGPYPHSIMLRNGCIVGPDSEQWTVRIARLLLARRLGDLGAAGDGCCNLLHINDVSDAILRAIRCELTEPRIFNLANPESPTWNEYLVQFALALGAVPVRRVSSRRLRLETKLLAPPLKIAEIAARTLHFGARFVPPPIPPSLLTLMAQDIRLNSDAATHRLGVRWTPLRDCILETANWYRTTNGSAR